VVQLAVLVSDTLRLREVDVVARAHDVYGVDGKADPGFPLERNPGVK
jgi:hypothetical protein